MKFMTKPEWSHGGVLAVEHNSAGETTFTIGRATGVDVYMRTLSVSPDNVRAIATVLNEIVEELDRKEAEKNEPFFVDTPCCSNVVEISDYFGDGITLRDIRDGERVYLSKAAARTVVKTAEERGWLDD